MNDPVCGLEVDPELCRLREMYKGHEYLFCGEACRKVFWLNPERFLPWRPGSRDRRKKSS